MSRLFYHVAQDNAGNLLFGVQGTMRLAGTGTNATIYGDEALTVILPNPMTNHASFGSFKCFLGVGDYDFYMAKSGYTFETLTGVQGSGTMADQNANAVAITGGTALLSAVTVTPLPSSNGVVVSDGTGTIHGFYGQVAAGTDKWNLFMSGTAGNYLQGKLGLGGNPLADAMQVIAYNKAADSGLILQQLVNDAGAAVAVGFKNVAGGVIGTIATSGVSTAYNTTSDGRLKEAIAPLCGALDIVRALNPVSFLWKADGSPGRGLLAHEVAEVVDGVITGERDAVDAEGNVQPQMIDYSKLVPYLIGAVKELTQQVEMLTAQLAAANA